MAGFRAWLKLGYCVRRGESSRIGVWAPCAPNKKRLQAWRDAGADPAQRPKTYFRLEAVFSHAQVEPLPPPAEPAPLQPPIAEILRGQPRLGPSAAGAPRGRARLQRQAPLAGQRPRGQL